MSFRLLGICGSVGSGKTSLISSVLGQLNIMSGRIGIDGKLAYVPQQAWIFHASVRENILFGMPWDERKYNRGKFKDRGVLSIFYPLLTCFFAISISLNLSCQHALLVNLLFVNMRCYAEST